MEPPSIASHLKYLANDLRPGPGIDRSPRSLTSIAAGRSSVTRTSRGEALHCVTEC